MPSLISSTATRYFSQMAIIPGPFGAQPLANMRCFSQRLVTATGKMGRHSLATATALTSAAIIASAAGTTVSKLPVVRTLALRTAASSRAGLTSLDLSSSSFSSSLSSSLSSVTLRSLVTFSTQSAAITAAAAVRAGPASLDASSSSFSSSLSSSLSSVTLRSFVTFSRQSAAIATAAARRAGPASSRKLSSSYPSLPSPRERVVNGLRATVNPQLSILLSSLGFSSGRIGTAGTGTAVRTIATLRFASVLPQSSKSLTAAAAAAIIATRPSSTRALLSIASGSNYINKSFSWLGGSINTTSSITRVASRTFSSTSSSASSLSSLPLLVTPGAETSVSRWLFFSAGWVASMVVLGGVTRLTRSGLSMTDWRFAGKLPPLTATDWEVEFEKYKASPEYKRVNRGMTLKEFQFIYWMEYAHRMWGRALGIAFVVPLSYFLARGVLRPRLVVRLSLLGAFGAAQGFVGWWMVKSGLEEPRTDHDVPRVSPYRLATHLACAVTIYSSLLWTAFQVAGWPTTWGSAAGPMNALQVAGVAQLRRMAHPLTGLLALTFLSGAFVAGNDAGHAYNTFPTMNGAWIPPEILDMRPLWHNFFENTATVQFDHRVLALSTLTAVSSVWLAARRLPLPPTPRLLVHCLLGATAVQVSLGLTALLYHVPVAVGAAHQAGALTLFTVALALLHATKKHPPTAHEAAYVRKSVGEMLGMAGTGFAKNAATKL
eukprot:TRINITY_DN2330_c0_g1_i1.p1 TRINITY_DN2330_c0_g1~~TRINITY_DN2330_c0_g1_i1.p1  ORF type:complete len:717 (-),score=91.31 TRINITY_DN2330_c0_g1_i1:383-2533(-)